MDPGTLFDLIREKIGMTRLDTWLQIGANTGILVGLVLVGAQIYQSNEITAAELFSDNLESTVTRELGLLGDTPEISMARILYEPEKATRNDYFVADRIYLSITRQLARAVVLSAENFYGNNDSIGVTGFVSVNYHLFACPYGLAWLDQTISMTASEIVGENLISMRELASNRLAVNSMEDRIKRTNVIAGRLRELGQL
jgi:hypothetical protein